VRTPSQPGSKPRSEAGPLALDNLFRALAGGLLGLALLKFGNPIILDHLIEPPKDVLEFWFQPWPVRWGYVVMIGVAALAFRIWKRETGRPHWLALLPLVWLGWQWMASARTTDAALTRPTILHFTICVAWFYVGFFALSQAGRWRWFWIPITLAFLWVLWMGFEQHYGGLEATRRHFYEQPDWQNYPPDYLKKIASDRIFSTLVYPNALAGALLLLTPPVLVTLWQLLDRLTPIARATATGIIGYAAFACLIWSGSKSGWLIALGLGLLILFRTPFSTRIKVIVAAVALVLGLTAFFVRYAGYFQKGATSIGARFDYWTAAGSTARDNPVLGTGPGTFSIAYSKIKPPEAEMARLVHNDYLQQASDSGILGTLTYTTFMFGSLLLLARGLGKPAEFPRLPVYLGLLGWSAQAVVEFPLYIPALAWPAFCLLGWLWGTRTAASD
jgi:hypothetical protein